MLPVVDIAVGVASGLLISYAVLITALLLARPEKDSLRETVRLLPDALRLVRRLASDPMLPRGCRGRLWLLLGYLALPFDVVPDFVPVVGYADDAIVTGLVLRSVIRRAGVDRIRRHWTGTPAGLTALGRVVGVDFPSVEAFEMASASARFPAGKFTV